VPTSYSFSELHDFSPKGIFYIHEDESRNIWFGTNQGLYKWNGCEFKNYQNINFSNSYSSIQEDSTGRIWCLNFTGQLFYVENDSLNLFSNDKELIRSTFDYSVTYFPSIFTTSNYGLIEYNYYTKQKIIHNKVNDKNNAILYNGDSLYTSRIKQLTTYQKGLVYWRNNLLEIKEGGKPPEVLLNKSVSFNRQLPFVIQIKANLLLMDDTGNSLFIGNDSLMRIKTPYKINTASIFFDIEKHLFFIGTTNGLIILSEDFKPIYKGHILEGNNISKIIKDEEGNYWIATLNEGVFIIPSLSILQYSSKIINNKKISYIIKNRNNKPYFFEEYGDIYTLNSFQTLEYVGSFNERVEHISYNPYRNEIYAGNLRHSFDLTTKKLINNVYGGDIKSVTFLDSNSILTSTSGSSNIRIPALIFRECVDLIHSISLNIDFVFNKNERNFASTIRQKRSIINSFDYKNKIAYIAYSDGLFYYKNGIEHELRLESLPILLSALSPPRNGIVWATTINNDLIKIDNGKILSVIHIDAKAKEILVWKNFLFINTIKGILKYNIDSQNKNWINTIDGLPNNNILDIEIINDKLYAATTDGLVTFNCNYDYINKQKPLIKISRIALWEKDTILSQTYSLKHNQNNITFYFNANANRSRNTYTYKYRILGIDSTWINQGTEINFARYPTIPPGDYTFQVKSINEDAIESDIAEIKLYIDKPYYKKWWFYLLIGVLLIAIVSVLFTARIKNINNKNKLINDKKEVEKLLSQSQLTALRSQMNPHFIFNALNSIQDYIITNNKEMASDYLGLFADLMRKYLHYSNEDEISLEEEVETLDMYLQLEKVRFEETLSYSIIVDENLDTLRVKIPVMLVQPFAENAIKHGLLHKKGKRILDIKFNKKGKDLIISIIDNGIGRKQSAEINKMRNRSHKSFATSAQQKRIDLINQENSSKIVIKYTDLEDSLNQSIGTLVEIALPLS